LFAAGAAGAPLEIRTAGDGAVRILQGGRDLLIYQTRPPAGSDARAGYIHPLYAPGGKLLTANAPTAHAHHRGIFWGWHQILIDGKPAANSWLLDGIAYDMRETSTRLDPDGSAHIFANLDWRAKDPAGGESAAAQSIVRERTEIVLKSESESAYKLTLTVALQALRAGVSIGGSPDAKGYGGISLRLRDGSHMRFANARGAITPTVEMLSAVGPITMAWDRRRELSRVEVTVSCSVDAKPVTSWVLRREQSMQNCAWPGPAAISLSLERPTILTATVNVRQKPR
jgi:hypothetical protein